MYRNNTINRRFPEDCSSFIKFNSSPMGLFTHGSVWFKWEKINFLCAVIFKGFLNSSFFLNWHRMDGWMWPIPPYIVFCFFLIIFNHCYDPPCHFPFSLFFCFSWSFPPFIPCLYPVSLFLPDELPVFLPLRIMHLLHHVWPSTRSFFSSSSIVHLGHLTWALQMYYDLCAFLIFRANFCLSPLIFS